MEILLDNPIVLIILIGFISSLFKKIKGNASDGQKTRPARPVSMPANLERNHTPGGSGTGTQTNIQQLYQDTKQRGVKVPDEPVSRSARGRRLGETNPQLETQSSERRLDFEPDSNSLVEGIIWSEVLGPPRSKKPYSSGRRN